MNYDAVADKGMAAASAEDRSSVDGLKQGWLEKRAPKLHAAMQSMKGEAGGLQQSASQMQDAYGKLRGDAPPMPMPGLSYEDPRAVAAQYNLGDLVAMYSRTDR